MGDTERFLAVHALKVKGLASAEDLAEVTGRTDLAPVLEELTGEELVKLRTGRIGGYALTKTGREAHPALLAAAVTDEERAGVAKTYEAFLPVNGRFKQICTRWQMRDGGSEPNDHSDADYDARVVDELAKAHKEVVEALAPAADVSARFGWYPVRFEAALERVRGGDVAAFARPMSNSYHDVWMELHEDLMLTLGRERDAADGH
ncbi:MarR family transcriptional regulator [Pseudonocardia sp. H11422]|uniref:MarR family transcriptional regulator n=1 Tax=Pseudonocardia sp. H11422 TaxID=2835866 RepID=UPI001BDCEF2C|nr:MarR family transcriptional regulator [Pseudonocardia sp. H11422]